MAFRRKSSAATISPRSRSPFSRSVSLVDRFRLAFVAFDKDGSGTITADELNDFMNELGVPFTQEQLCDLLDGVDLDHDGGINYQEFIPLLRKMLAMVLKTPTEIKQLHSISADRMEDLKARLAARSVIRPERQIRHVVLVVIVLEEIKPVLEHFHAQPDPETDAKMLGLATAFTCTVGEEGSVEAYRLTVLQAANSAIYHRHYSGYSQAAAIMALVARDLDCDLVISFGTAGGVVGQAEIGDALLANGCVYIDRLRTSSKTAFDWGVHGGPVLPAHRMAEELGLVEGLLGSQISYTVTQGQVHLMETLQVVALDMEAAPEAEIAQQVGLNFLALKMVSNGVHPGNGDRMEEEYREYKARVSEAGVHKLSAVLDYLKGKRLCDLA